MIISKKDLLNQVKAEQMIELIAKWLARGAQGAELAEHECFGTVQQDLAIGFAQELFDSVGLPTNSLFKMAFSLDPGTEKTTDNTIIKFPQS